MEVLKSAGVVSTICAHARLYVYLEKATGVTAPDTGSIVFTQSSMTDSGDSGVPEGLKLSVSGSSSGKLSSGSGTALPSPP